MNRTTSSSPTNTQRENAPIDREWLTVRGFNRLWSEDEEFRAFARQVYHYLDSMRPGRVVTFRRYTGKKLEWCIRTAGAFLSESIHRWDWWIGDDYLSVHRAAEHFSPVISAPERNSAMSADTVSVHRHPGIHVGLNTRIG